MLQQGPMVMAQITRTRAWPAARRSARKRLHLPLSLLVTLCLIVGLTLLIFSAQVLAEHGPASAVFETWFEDIAPGQALSAAEARVLCPGGLYTEQYCSVRFTEGPFSQVLTVVVNSAIRRVDFMVRQDALRIGDLVAVLGRPQIRREGQQAYLRWRSGITALAIVDTGNVTLLLPVLRVSLGEAEF